MNQFLKFDIIAKNIEMVLGGHFDATYNEHRGPIQIVHQIERVRSSPFFEDNGFYRRVLDEELHQGGSFNPLDRAIGVVDANTRGWIVQTIDRTVELAAAGRWHQENFSLGDMIWAVYLHFQTGGDRNRMIRALEEYFKIKVREDGGDFHYNSEWSVNTMEGKTVKMVVDAAITRLKEVS